jgi:glyoxylase-like metal-dependent hydrolase (beta-lactamase superfamily II)
MLFHGDILSRIDEERKPPAARLGGRRAAGSITWAAMTNAVATSQLIDVEYLGKRRYIAACLLLGDVPALVDPGPSVSLPALRAGLAAAGLQLDDLGAVLLTHIHHDHAGAAGTIVAHNPRVEVYVHERGAPHLIDPSRLLARARRLYGDRMDALWGEFAAVPEANVRPLSGGETIAVAGRRLEVAYTPGHAVHHVSYLDTADGTAFVGDTAGVRIANLPFVMPVTPPPDIDLEGWEDSLEKIAAWRPQRLFVTHFGPAEGVRAHIEEHRRRLRQWAEAVQEDLASGAADEVLTAAFRDDVLARLNERLPAEEAAAYRQGGAPDMSWQGLARYWRKKWETES